MTVLHNGTLDHWREKRVVSRNMRKLLGALASGEPRTVLELIDEVYDEPGGGPLGAENCIRQLVFQTQKRLGGRVKIEPSPSYVLTLEEPGCGGPDPEINVPRRDLDLD